MPKKLRVIPEPAPGTRAMIVSPLAPAISGLGSEDFSCGNCDKLLITGIGASVSFESVVIKCPACGACNETPSSISTI